MVTKSAKLCLSRTMVSWESTESKATIFGKKPLFKFALRAFTLTVGDLNISTMKNEGLNTMGWRFPTQNANAQFQFRSAFQTLPDLEIELTLMEPKIMREIFSREMLTSVYILLLYRVFSRENTQVKRVTLR